MSAQDLLLELQVAKRAVARVRTVLAARTGFAIDSPESLKERAYRLLGDTERTQYAARARPRPPGVQPPFNPDPDQGLLGGNATSNSVFNPLDLPGFQTGSFWTVHIYEEPGLDCDDDDCDDDDD